MAAFSASYQESFIVPAAPDIARAHFGDVNTIGTHYGPVESWKRIDDRTLYIKLQPQEQKGIKFQGEYTAQYAYNADGSLTWTTISDGNMRSTGVARFQADAKGTRVTYEQTISVEMEVNRVLAKVLAPFVSMGVRDGIRDYLARMRAAL